jgi:hypothetical protein
MIDHFSRITRSDRINLNVTGLDGTTAGINVLAKRVNDSENIFNRQKKFSFLNSKDQNKYKHKIL